MKKQIFGLMALILGACISFTACSDDDDDDNQNEDLWVGNLENAKYEADAVAFDINGSSEISFIELTSSGNYIVLPASSYTNYSGRSCASDERHSFLKSVITPVSRSGEFHKFGKFSKTGQNEFMLENFGRLVINSGNNLDLYLTNGEHRQLNGTRRSKMESTALNDRFCRSWKLQHIIEQELDANGKVVSSHECSTPEELQEDYIMLFVMSKAKTFLQIDWDNTFDDFGEWKWLDESQQTFAYRWNDDPDFSGYISVKFNGNKCIFTEEYKEEYAGYRTVATCVAI